MKSYLSSPGRLAVYFFNLLPVILAVFAPVAIAEDYKIGVVDARAVLEQTPQADNMAAALRAEFEGRNRELIEMRQFLTNMDVRLTTGAEEMSEQEKAGLERKRFQLDRDLARAEQIYKEDISIRRNEILTALQEEIIDAIRAVSLQHNFDIVLSEGVNWATKRVNMTPLVIEYMKSKSEDQGGTGQ